MDTVCRYLDAGISRVILGTAALEDPAFLKSAVRRFGERIAVGVDMKDGKVAVKGWLETSAKDGLEFLTELEDLGIRSAIVTDISRDGAMQGTNRNLYRTLTRRHNMNIIASGGVSALEDLSALREVSMVITRGILYKDPQVKHSPDVDDLLDRYM